MIRVSFVWRRLLTPICTILTDHQPYLLHLGDLTEDDVDRWSYCPRCYAGWPYTIRIERA